MKRSLTKKKVPTGTNKDKIYQLKISLEDSSPVIWRQILVSGNTDLGELHRIIQTVMGWTDSHLHEFLVNEVSYADLNPEMEMTDAENERHAKLYHLALKPGSSFTYVYDFGDYWVHKVEVEQILEQHEKYLGISICLGGQLSCPPEDCGGIYGYYNLLKIISDPENPEYKFMKEWVGSYFQPDKFDLELVNDLLGPTPIFVQPGVICKCHFIHAKQ